MLEKFIPHLIKDLELGDVSLGTGTPGVYSLPLEEGLKITMADSPNGFILKCAIAPYPKEREEIFATQALLANLFGQGTKGAVLGMTTDGNTLTLTQEISYQVDYKEFMEILEDFINTVDMWYDETINFK